MAAGLRRQVREQTFAWDKAVRQFVPTADRVGVDGVQRGPRDAETQRRRGRFLKGPVPWEWIVRASELPGKALIVGLSLWRLSGAIGKATVTLGNNELEPFGIDRAAKSRALTALEGAGLIMVERRRGRLPIVTISS
jgi:DNA-binding transcriptional ArsR family regulator